MEALTANSGVRSHTHANPCSWLAIIESIRSRIGSPSARTAAASSTARSAAIGSAISGVQHTGWPEGEASDIKFDMRQY